MKFTVLFHKTLIFFQSYTDVCQNKFLFIYFFPLSIYLDYTYSFLHHSKSILGSPRKEKDFRFACLHVSQEEQRRAGLTSGPASNRHRLRDGSWAWRDSSLSILRRTH